MDSSDIDGDSLQAVKSLRSKFEQLAVSDLSLRPLANTNSVDMSPQPPGAVNPRSRQSSGSQGYMGTSPSSDLKVVTKRLPPPPPPPRIAKQPLSPLPSRSPSPLYSVRVDLGNAHKQEVLGGISALKSKS